MIRPLLLAVVLCLANAAHAEPLVTLYHNAFDDGKVDGPVGKAGSMRTIDASRIIDFERGTFAYFTHVTKPVSISEWNRLAGVNGIRGGGYWGMAMDFSIRREDFIFNLYDVGRYARPMHLQTPFGRWNEGEWHHLAAVWDRHEGIKVYEDGKLVTSNWGDHHWTWSLIPDKFFARGTVDEVYIFADALTDAQIAQLANGQSPTGSPIPRRDDDVTRQRDLQRMGWTGDSLAVLPTVASGGAVTIAFARITEIMDAKRPDNHAFDGISVTTWPNEMYGASIRGEQMEITLEDGATYDRVRVFAHRPLDVALKADDTLATISTYDARIVHTKLPASKATDLILTRDRGQIGELDFYRVDSSARKTGDIRTFHFARADDLPQGMTGDTLVAETAHHLRKFAHASADAGDAWTLDAPAFGGFQAVSDPLGEANAYDGAVVTLVASNVTEPTPVRIKVKEPVHGLRDWLIADAVLEPKGSGKQTWTVHVTGRPVINMPQYEKQRYWKDGKYHDEFDTIPGMPIGVSVTAANPVTWHLGSGGTTVGLSKTDIQTALPIAADDQQHYMREAYADVMEGHGYRLPRIVIPTTWLVMFAPDRMPVRQMYERMGSQRLFKGIEEHIKPLVRPETPNNTGAPDWAFWQMQAMNEHLRLLHWRIDNQQVRTGEFGGVWNDDTIHTENWYGYMLCMDDSGKIKNAMRKFWDGNWNHLHEGVGRYTQDVCHFYEEGMGSQAMRILIDYGDPIAHKRAMAAASHYDHWFNIQPDGTYLWNSEYINHSGAWLEQDFGVNPRQGGHKWDMMVPGGYLIWFNRHPQVAKVYNGLARQGDDRGVSFHGYAMSVLDDLDAAKEKWVEQAVTRAPRDFKQYNATIDAVGLDDRIKNDQQFEYAEAGPIGHYWGAKDTDEHYFKWRVTGDLRYLVDSYKRVCDWFYSHDWLNTAAMASMDRNPLPRYSLIRARLGAIVAQRGSSGLLWPLHAFSFDKGANDVASLVTENTEDGFTTRLYAFTDQPHDMTLRSWRPKPGTYKLTVTHDGKQLSEQTLDLTRGSAFDVTIPARQQVTLSLTAVSNHELDYTLPDLAISAATCPMVYSEHQVVYVYNLGRTAVENVLVRARDLHSGEIIVNGEKRIARIEAANDLSEPQYGTVEFKNINANILKGVIIEVDPDDAIEELIPFNNRVIVKY